MLRYKILPLAVCLIYLFACFPTFATTTEGNPWGGEAVVVSSSGTTMLYASRKNINAEDSGASVFDIYGWTNTVEENPEKMAVKANESGESWYYTVDIEKAGRYQIDVLGWGGYAYAPETEAKGRFSFEIGGVRLADGTGENPVILPPWGEGTAVGSNKTMTEFTDDDKVCLGIASLNEGTQVIKITADNHASGHMGFSKIWLTSLVEGDPWGGEAVNVTAYGTTTIYAARKNRNAADAGVSVFDIYGWTNTVEDNPEKMAVKAVEAGASWYYTINVEKAGEYQVDVLGWSGWTTAEQNDGGGRFSFEIDGAKLADGKGENPVILPPWGEGTASGSHKAMTEFNHEDMTKLGSVLLDEGVHIIKMTADNHASGHMGFREIRLTSLAKGEPWGGEAVRVTAPGTTTIYAARKNVNAADGGTEVFDFYGWTNTVEENPEKMAVKAVEEGAGWYYTVDIEKSGLYRLETLGWGGYAYPEQNDGGGRFSLEIDGTTLVDGKGENPVILPPWGEGTAAGSNKAMTEFTDEDMTDLGAVYLSEGTRIIKVTADNTASGFMGFVKFCVTWIDCGNGDPQSMVSVGWPIVDEEGNASLEVTSYGEKIKSAVVLAALKKDGCIEQIHMSDAVELEKGIPSTVRLSGLKTELLNGEHYTFYVWEGSGGLYPITEAFYGDSMLSEPPAEFRAADIELNDAYDFITDADGGFKAMYSVEQNMNEVALIQNIKDAGVNAFLIYIFHPDSMTETEYKAVIEKWKKNLGDVKLFTVVGYGSDGIYGNKQFGGYVSEDGTDINAPCPQSEEYWNLVYGQRAKWSYEAGAAGCVVDMEMYGAESTIHTGCCYCDDCWTDFCDAALFDEYKDVASAPERSTYLTMNEKTDQYKNFQTNRRIQILSKIRKQLPEDFMLGYMLYYEQLSGLAQGLGTPTAPALILDEYTYFADGSAGYDYTNRTKGHLMGIYQKGNPGILLPGFYPKTYTAENQKAVIDRITGIEYETHRADGFWIYSMDVEEIAGDGEAPTEYVRSLTAVKPKNNY